MSFVKLSLTSPVHTLERSRTALKKAWAYTIHHEVQELKQDRASYGVFAAGSGLCCVALSIKDSVVPRQHRLTKLHGCNLGSHR